MSTPNDSRPLRLAVGYPRRDFLLQSAALVGVAPSTLLSAEGMEPRRFQLGLATADIGNGWDWETLLAQCERLGFGAVEINAGGRHGIGLELSVDARRQIYERSTHKTNVLLRGLGCTLDLAAADEGGAQKAQAALFEYLQLAYDLHAGGVNLRLPPARGDLRWNAQTLKMLGRRLRSAGEYASRLKVELWLEISGPIESAAAAKIAWEECDHSAVGLTWDCQPSDVVGASIRSTFESVAPAIRNVHIHELWTRYPYRELFALLREYRYQQFTLAALPKNSDPAEVLRYYRRLWEELS